MQQPPPEQGDSQGSQAEQALDPASVERFLSQARDEQNVFLAILAGFFVSIACAVVWAALTVVTGWQVGLVAILVGCAVGISVRKVGKGMDTIFGVIGGVFALLGILLGNYFTQCWYLSVQEKVSVFNVALVCLMKPAIFIQIMTATFSFMDIIFYAIGIYEGYKFSFRTITQEDIQQFGAKH